VPFKRYRVLAAEDDPQLREVLRDALTHDGFEACCVADGLVARERFESSGPFDALLLDDRMPLLTGRELLRELRAAGQNVPVLILSGYCDAHDEEWAWRIGNLELEMSLTAICITIFRCPITPCGEMLEAQHINHRDMA
jgi:CheY-like chemotaxis protein